MKSLENQIHADSGVYAKILDSVLKVRMLMMLLIYPELTLTQLSKKMGKVKSTISKHMKELIKLDLVKQREQPARGSIAQKVYSAAKMHGYRGRTYKDLKDESPEQFIEHLQEEFQINLRLFSYIQEVNQQILVYINDFYTNLKPEDITDEFKEEIYRYNTCIPRVKFMTKEEYISYREEFLEWEDNFINTMEEKRLKESNDKPKEYLAINELLPIRQVLDHVINGKKKKNKNKD